MGARKTGEAGELGGAKGWEERESGLGREEGGRERGEKALRRRNGLEGHACRHGSEWGRRDRGGEEKERRGRVGFWI